MPADESALLDLFDFHWFEHQIFKKKTTPNVLEKCEQLVEVDDDDEPKLLSRVTTLHVRSYSDQIIRCQDFVSPNSVPQTTPQKAQQLHTILSGKVAGEFPEPEEAMQKEQQRYHCINKEEMKARIQRDVVKRRRRKNNEGVSSKSLSDLEFEELKGFMDLGFVFSEEDKNSSLVDIIPGLQRFGEEDVQKKEKKEKREEEESTYNVVDEKKNKSVEISCNVLKRPYLSEAWEFMEQREAGENMVKDVWGININAAVIGNEMDMKHQLIFWAQSVASAVK